MADPATAERMTGYMVGAISPIAQRRRSATVLDSSASAWDTILISGGRRGLEIELAAPDLCRVVDGREPAIGRPR